MSTVTERIHAYHSSFHGDTYDACQKCGGKCEQFKISTLIPGEKEYIAADRRMSLRRLEDTYLDRIDTPFGTVDVLKMKSGCPFLDKKLRCTVVESKPILCDSYPIVFDASGSIVEFTIDRHDCPMVRWSEYAECVRYFAQKGIPAMKRLKVPAQWWRTVALYDEFDFDYVRIEKELRKTPKYETFWLEEILGFACNGYEKRARRRGLDLLMARLKNETEGSMARLKPFRSGGNPFSRELAAAYGAMLLRTSREMRGFLISARRDSNLLSEPSGLHYRLLVIETRETIRRFKADTGSYIQRIRQASRVPRSGRKRGAVVPLPRNPERRFMRGAARPGTSEYRAVEIFGLDNRVGRQAYSLLAGSFAPDEIDGPALINGLFRESSQSGTSTKSAAAKSQHGRLWYRWVMVGLCDSKGKVVSAADGAIIASREATVFYASHMATIPGLRSRGLGALLTARILQAANAHLREAETALGACRWHSSQGMMLQHELGEIEFPDRSHLGNATIARLPFHGKAGRAVLWPLRYAQPDTNYGHRKFDAALWNSVPMFLSHRAFRPQAKSITTALKAAELLFDYFSAYSDSVSSKGVDWDRVNMMAGLRRDGHPRFVAMPSSTGSIRGFIAATGYAEEILPSLYRNHYYARERQDRFAIARKCICRSNK